MISHCPLEIPERKRKQSLDEFRENRELSMIQEELSLILGKIPQNPLNRKKTPFNSDLQNEKEGER